MARMIGDQPDTHFCCRYCWLQWGDSPKTKLKRKYKRHLKHRERRAVRKEIRDERA